MARAIIITSYLEYPLDIRALLRPEDYIVCLDGGYQILQSQALRPHLLLGDFDSLRVPLEEDPPFEIRRYPPEKDYTDLELAFRTLDPAKTPEVLVIGGLGGRLDQTLINIQLLQRYTAPPRAHDADGCRSGGEDPRYGSFRRFHHIELLDGHNRCFVVHAEGSAASGGSGFPSGAPMNAPSDPPACSVTIPRQPGCYLSLVPLTEECRGVDLLGAKYSLTDAVLRRGSTLSVSNEFRGEAARLRLLSGSLLVVVTKSSPDDHLPE